MSEAWIIDSVRTPRGRGKMGKGSLCEIHPQNLLAQTLNHLATRSGVNKADIDDVIAGCVTQAGEQGANVSRNSVLMADWPENVTGVALNRFCGSGLQAVNFGAMGVMSGQQKAVVAGGVESMSRVPMGTDVEHIDANNMALRKKLAQVPQGIGADLIATIEGFSRDDLDNFALQSQKKAEVAQKEGYFDKSLFAVKDPKSDAVALEKDEYPRHGSTLEALGGLNPAFEKLGALAVGPNKETLDWYALQRYQDVKAINHVHTAGNSSGIVDGAAAVLMTTPEYAKANGLKPRARIKQTTTWGSEPVIMLTAPTPTSQKCLERAGMQVSDIDLWEINEAFAAVPLQTIKKLGIDPERVNVNGGAIALGHPLGATGAMLLGTALDELERRNKTTALITLCIGGGMGIATIIERI